MHAWPRYTMHTAGRRLEFPAEFEKRAEISKTDLKSLVLKLNPDSVFPEELYILLSGLLELDPWQRLTARQVIGHSFFKLSL